MEQRSLFDLAASPAAVVGDNPIAHADDPSTSHEAAERHEASGRRGRHCRMVLALVGRHPGQTACELWELADQDEREELKEMQEVRRRLTDLAAAGQVRQGPARECRVRGSRMVTWEAAPGAGRP